MKKTFQPWHMNFEHRLCHFAWISGTPPQEVKDFFEWSKKLPGKLWEKIKDFNKTELQPLLKETEDFFRGMPNMRTYFDKCDMENLSSFEQFQVLMRQESWIQTFRTNPQIFLDTYANKANGPVEEFLLELTSVDRRKLYREFLHYLVPRGVQRNQILPATKKTIEQFLRDDFDFKDANVQKDIALLSGAAGDILGMDNPPKQTVSPQQTQIASESLKEFYQLSDDKVDLRKGLRDDYATNAPEVLQHGGGVGVTRNNLIQYLGSSRLKGAVRLGILSDQQLATLETEELQDRKTDREKLVGDISRDLEKLTNTTNSEMAREALGVAGVWKKMGAFEKLVLIALAAFGLVKSKKLRGAALIAGGVYFAQRLFLGNEGVKMLDKSTNKFGQLFTKKNREVFGEKGIGMFNEGMTGTSIIDRAAVSADFLDEYQRDELDTEGTALTLFMDVPLSDLAKSFETKGGYGELNVGKDSPALLKLFDIVGRQRDEKAVTCCNDFIRNKNNIDEISDALTYVFYKIAIQSLAKVPQNDVKLVEEAVAGMPSDKGFADIPTFFKQSRPEVVAAYEKLVISGRNQAVEDGRTLGQFMRTEVGIKEQAL